MLFRVTKDVEPLLKESAIHSLTLQVGVMTSQPAHGKARKIECYCRMAYTRRMNVERKYDGEYCQIHIDLSKDRDFITLFSKSGKDSTKDRIDLYDVPRDSLWLGRGAKFGALK
jgi:DNA ligase-4